jgi:hypothetical protein
MIGIRRLTKQYGTTMAVDDRPLMLAGSGDRVPRPE